MSEIPTHDFNCPCDMCEPEAHSVAEYPTPLASGRLSSSQPNVQDLNRGLEMALERSPVCLRDFDYHMGSSRTAETQPPSSAADVETAAFESLVKQVGEGKARWTRLIELLELDEACERVLKKRGER